MAIFNSYFDITRGYPLVNQYFSYAHIPWGFHSIFAQWMIISGWKHPSNPIGSSRGIPLKSHWNPIEIPLKSHCFMTNSPLYPKIVSFDCPRRSSINCPIRCIDFLGWFNQQDTPITHCTTNGSWTCCIISHYSHYIYIYIYIIYIYSHYIFLKQSTRIIYH